MLSPLDILTTTLVVSDGKEALADEKARAILQVLQSQGLVAVQESLNAVDAWIGSLPGQVYANIRQPLIHTLNLAHLAPLSSVWAGPEKNEHLNGPPLSQVASDGTTPFRLVPHQGDVGHMMVVGPTGGWQIGTPVAHYCAVPAIFGWQKSFSSTRGRQPGQ